MSDFLFLFLFLFFFTLLLCLTSFFVALYRGSHTNFTMLYIISAENFVITFHNKVIPRFDAIPRRLDNLKDISFSHGWISYAILDFVVGEVP